jgi:hypothetical protein
MPWTSLATTLGDKPLVLAGPILRKVTPKSVTVWLALRWSVGVKLMVFDDQNAQRMEGTRRPVEIPHCRMMEEPNGQPALLGPRVCLLPILKKGLVRFNRRANLQCCSSRSNFRRIMEVTDSHAMGKARSLARSVAFSSK